MSGCCFNYSRWVTSGLHMLLSIQIVPASCGSIAPAANHRVIATNCDAQQIDLQTGCATGGDSSVNGYHVCMCREMLDTPGPYLLDVMVPHVEHVLPMIPGGASFKDVITDGDGSVSYS